MTFETYVISHPHLSIIVFSAVITFFISIVNFFIMDKDKMKQLKARQKEIQAQLKKHQKEGNQEKMMELNKELLSQTGETLKHSLRPMLITMIPVLLSFNYMRKLFMETALQGTWFWWYLGSAIVFSIFFRKLFKLP